MFTIDSDNNIVAHAGTPASTDHAQSFSTEKELAALAAEWPASRLVEIWNSLAGVAPFDDLKAVKKFTNRNTAVRRICEAVARLIPIVAPPVAPVAPVKGNSTKAPAQPKARHTVRKEASEAPANKKAEVIAMMKRPKGVTLGEIMETTGWQKHTVRGFVSILGSKGGQKIESAKNADGERRYRITK